MRREVQTYSPDPERLNRPARIERTSNILRASSSQVLHIRKGDMEMQRSKGFTLVELVAIIAVIAILAAVLFPVFAQARMAKTANGMSYLRQREAAMKMYTQDYDDLLSERNTP